MSLPERIALNLGIAAVRAALLVVQLGCLVIVRVLGEREPDA